MSRLHSKLEPASLEVKVKPAEVEAVAPGGPLVIEVWGGETSGGGAVGDAAGGRGEIRAGAVPAGLGLGEGVAVCW